MLKLIFWYILCIVANWVENLIIIQGLCTNSILYCFRFSNFHMNQTLHLVGDMRDRANVKLYILVCDVL